MTKIIEEQNKELLSETDCFAAKAGFLQALLKGSRKEFVAFRLYKETKSFMIAGIDIPSVREQKSFDVSADVISSGDTGGRGDYSLGPVRVGNKLFDNMQCQAIQCAVLREPLVEFLKSIESPLFVRDRERNAFCSRQEDAIELQLNKNTVKEQRETIDKYCRKKLWIPYDPDIMIEPTEKHVIFSFFVDERSSTRIEICLPNTSAVLLFEGENL